MMTPEEARSRCWAEVDLTRLKQNYRSALKHLTTAKLIAVLASAFSPSLPTMKGRSFTRWGWISTCSCWG